jgi:hypothetical protein
VLAVCLFVDDEVGELWAHAAQAIPMIG